MAGIHSLPPEVLVKIFVLAGSADSIKACVNTLVFIPGPSNPLPRKSRDLYALATSSKSLYATFKANEYEIFLALVKEIAFKLQEYPADEDNKSAASFAYREILNLHWLGSGPPLLDDIHMGESAPKTAQETEARIERMCQQDIRQVIKPRQFGRILAAVRWRILESFFGCLREGLRDDN